MEQARRQFLPVDGMDGAEANAADCKVPVGIGAQRMLGNQHPASLGIDGHHVAQLGIGVHVVDRRARGVRVVVDHGELQFLAANREEVAPLATPAFGSTASTTWATIGLMTNSRNVSIRNSWTAFACRRIASR